MNKNQLRKRFLEQRKQLSLKRLQQISQAISQNFLDGFELTKIKKLHIFLPILKQNEINTWFIIKEIFQNYPQIKLVTSKSDFQTRNMESYLLDTHTQIIENRWGIPEPINAIKCREEEIDMILIPLLCFDQQGFRVGYGKGFYDRFLSKCQKEIIKIGLSPFEPVEKITDINDNDLKMDFCIMKERIWKR